VHRAEIKTSENTTLPKNNNREENLTKHARSIYAYVKKAEKMGRVKMREVATRRKARLINR